MSHMFTLEDATTVVTVSRAVNRGQSVLSVYVQGDLDHDATGMQFQINATDAYMLGQNLAKSLEEAEDDTEPVLLRLDEHTEDVPLEFTLSPGMAGQFARQLIRRLGN